MSMQRGMGILAGGVSLAGLAAGPAAASTPGADLVAWGGAGFAALVSGIMFLALRHAWRRNAELERRLAEAEAETADMETLLSAEPHALIVWEGRNPQPVRVFARLQLLPGVPRSEEKIVAFEEWLDEPSARHLSEALQRLRDEATPFNIAVRTPVGELLEADGRTAGYNIVLHFRLPLGERREMMELAGDVDRLGRQVGRLSAILDTAPMPVWLRDDDGALLWANRAWLAAVGQKDLDVAIAAGACLVPPEKMELASESADPPHKVWRGDTVIDGQKRILAIHEQPLEEGTVCCWAVDRTGENQLRAQLESHIEAHKSTLDRLLAAIAIFGPDRRLMFSNTAFARLWELDEDWLASGVTWDEILDTLRERRKLPEQADFRSWKERQMEVFTALEGRSWQWHLPSGRSLNVTTELHPQGGVIFVFEDITEQRVLESRYKALMGVQRETLDNLHEAVALFGTDGRLKLFNPSFADFWQLDRAMLEEAPHIDRIMEAARPLVEDDDWWDLLKYSITGMSDRRESRRRRITLSDGRVYDGLIVPLPDGNTLITWYDMSDAAEKEKFLREKNEALMQADRLKSGFLASVSYELRTPLNSIIGFTQALEMEIAGPLQPKQREYIGDIHTASTDLMGTIDTLLDLSTIDAGLMELQVEQVDVAQVMEVVANRLAERLEQRDLTVHLDLAGDATVIHADRRRLEQVLSNILANAIGFSPQGGRISMGARRTASHMELWISDQGAGMDPDAARRAFERFSSRPAPGSHGRPRLGLGLPLARSLVELHGGEVELISQPGKGTTVICRFPLAAAAQRPAVGEAAP